LIFIVALAGLILCETLKVIGLQADQITDDDPAPWRVIQRAPIARREARCRKLFTRGGMRCRTGRL
jgi:hypothetical protein